MPRHMLPNVGTTVWYFADPTVRPQAAIVAKRISETSFNLMRINPQTGAATAATAVPFLGDPGLKPASGPYCTPTGIQDTVDGATDVQSNTSRVTAVAVAVAGTGYTNNALAPLGNGVSVRLTAAAGPITAATIVTAGSVLTGSEPANPVAVPGGTSGTVNLTWTAN